MGRSATETTVHGLFARRAHLTSGARAIQCGPRELSYAELVVAPLGVLKTGAAYVALDPAERRAAIVADAEIAVVVTVEQHRHLVEASAVVVPHDDAVAVFDAVPGHPDDVAYTSGATGQPRGVVVPHRAVRRLANDMEIWGSLLNGATMAVVDRQALAKRRDRPGLDVVYRTPGNATEKWLSELWQEIMDIDTVGVDEDYAYGDPHQVWHTMLRAPLAKALSSNALRAKRPVAQRIVRRVLAPLAYGQPWDLAKAAADLPMAFVGALMGLSESGWAELTRLTTMAIAPDDPSFRTDAGSGSLVTAHHELFDYFADQVHGHASRDDLIRTMAVGDRAILLDEIIYNCYSLLLGAIVTMPRAMAATVLVFIDNPPYRFDVGRSPNRHVAFGFGAHYCIGAPFARIALQLFFDEFVRLVERVEHAGPVDHLVSNFAAGIKSMPITASLAD